ncbi:MAG: hypothetical protein Q8936_06630 [Bacillota bacterium]|nr:hypothetical protein [Bacillota bacterium]
MTSEKLNIEVIINEAAEKAGEIGAKKAILEFSKEIKDKRLHNTRLLMKNYNKLKDHVDNVRADVEFDIEYAEDKVWLTSVVRTKLRTMRMMAMIDSALAIIKEKARKDCIEYKYKAFELFYIDEKKNDEIIESLKCGKNQPKIWSDYILNELSIYLWGIESLGI